MGRLQSRPRRRGHFIVDWASAATAALRPARCRLRGPGSWRRRWGSPAYHFLDRTGRLNRPVAPFTVGGADPGEEKRGQRLVRAARVDIAERPERPVAVEQLRQLSSVEPAGARPAHRLDRGVVVAVGAAPALDSASTVERGVVGGRQVLERQRAQRRVSPDSTSASKPSTSILQNAGSPCSAIRSSSVDDIDLDRAVPADPGEAAVGGDRVDPGRRHRRDGRRRRSRWPAGSCRPRLRRPAGRSRRRRRGRRTAAAPARSRAAARPPRPAPQSPPGPHPAADVCADVEADVAGPEELAVEPRIRRCRPGMPW